MNTELTPTAKPLPITRMAESRLKGRRLAESPPILRGLSTTALVLAGIAWLSTVGLAFMLGRASIERLSPSPALLVQARPPIVTPVIAAHPAPVAVSSQTPEPRPEPTLTFPRFVSTVPTQFRGSWDEIVSDRCEGREARYMITATTFNNFEVHADVERIKLISPTEVELSLTGYDEDRNQFNSKIGFRLDDNRRSLVGIGSDSNVYRRCPG